jgi:uncharacterized protein YlxP (DUF503 family)
VYVGVLKIALLVRDSHSLKDKRAVVRRIKDRVEQKFKLGIAEVGALDLLQRAELGVAVAGSDRTYVSEVIDHIVGFVRGLGAAEVIDDRRDVFVYGDDAVGWRGTGPDPGAPAADASRTGHGDKVGADDWVPDEWKREAER